MESTDRYPDPRALPEEIPIFPLTGALLLPGGRLPLNIFEPRYLAMTDAALGAGRWLGMVQPRDTTDQTVADGHPVFDIGCLGRIVSFQETDDARFLITLKGICRFQIERELALTDGFRRVRVRFDGFLDDLEPESLGPAARERLIEALKAYFARNGYEADWAALDQAADDALVASMAMACPFSASEKQALLEASDLRARARSLVAVLNMASHDTESAKAQPPH